MHAPTKKASHQRRPDSFKATSSSGAIFFIDSIRPVTHALIASRTEDGREYHTIACLDRAQAERKQRTLEAQLYWTSFEIVELVRPATTGGELERPVEAR